VSLLFAVSGSLVAAWLGNRKGCLKPLIVAHLVFFAGLAVLTQARLFAPYAIGACLVMFSVGLGIAYAVSTVAELDLDGRYVVLTVPFIGLGVMAGPGIAGMLASEEGYAPVLAFGAVSLALSLAAFVLGARGTRAAAPGSAADLHMERWP
jgi:predicted MFS family arabinose efflux permease